MIPSNETLKRLMCFELMLQIAEAVACISSVKKLLLKFSQNSQENTCNRAFFNKVVGGACNFI